MSKAVDNAIKVLLAKAAADSALARADVLVVVILIRYNSHVFGNVQAYCAEAGKRFVRAPGGYSVNTLAHTILEQARRQLGARAT